MTEGPILLLGAGGHARACIDVIEREGRFTVAGVVGLPAEVGARVLGYSVVGVDADLPALLENYSNAMVTVGQIKTPEPRMRLFNTVERSGSNSPVVISPNAYVSAHSSLGAGTIVMHGAVINAGAVIGRNCIINSRALVEHDVVIGDHCHVATAAVLNGGVSVGAGSFVGSGSVVRQGVVIGERAVIGMGQRILMDCPDGACIPPLVRST